MQSRSCQAGLSAGSSTSRPLLPPTSPGATCPVTCFCSLVVFLTIFSCVSPFSWRIEHLALDTREIIGRVAAAVLRPDDFCCTSNNCELLSSANSLRAAPNCAAHILNPNLRSPAPSGCLFFLRTVNITTVAVILINIVLSVIVAVAVVVASVTCVVALFSTMHPGNGKKCHRAGLELPTNCDGQWKHG